MVNIDPTALGLEFGGGAAIGALMGFAAKKIAKLIAVIIGVQLVIFRYLESQGILIVDWSALSNGLIKTSEHADPSYLESLISTMSVGAGFTAGFLIGFRRG
ncbi:FUN14 domain-containing protein [Natronosalvus caseinilyticus]|uniref:FUN14 domain-containing protein n=1 Tax=Natronosalvus caseinilyticus TaxID=2953747 RepID=UPI0028A7D8A7|nr:FUN14 domain-containing protein [Natronosalvus caseinilyticus]